MLAATNFWLMFHSDYQAEFLKVVCICYTWLSQLLCLCLIVGRYQANDMSICLTPLAQKQCIVGLWLRRTLIGNSMMEVELTGQFGHIATK